MGSEMCIRDRNDLIEYLCYNEVVVVCLQNSLDRELTQGENIKILDEDLGEI